jgi:hypothetical protein
MQVNRPPGDPDGGARDGVQHQDPMKRTFRRQALICWWPSAALRVRAGRSWCRPIRHPEGSTCGPGHRGGSAGPRFAAAREEADDPGLPPWFAAILGADHLAAAGVGLWLRFIALDKAVRTSSHCVWGVPPGLIWGMSKGGATGAVGSGRVGAGSGAFLGGISLQPFPRAGSFSRWSRGRGPRGCPSGKDRSQQHPATRRQAAAQAHLAGGPAGDRAGCRSREQDRGAVAPEPCRLFARSASATKRENESMAVGTLAGVGLPRCRHG